MKQSLALHKFLVRLLVIVMTMFAAIYVLLGTQLGLNLTWMVAQRYIPGNITIGSLQGNLASRLSVANLEYTDATAKISLKSLNINWDIWKLLLKRVSINNFEIQDLTVNILASQSDGTHSTDSGSNDSSGTDLSWLSWLDMQNAKIINADIMLGKNDHYKIDQLIIHKNQDGIHTLALKSSVADVTGHYELGYFPELNWQADLKATHIQMGELSSGIVGKINIDLQTSGKWGRFTQKVRVSKLSAVGNLNKNPLNLNANFAYDDGVFTVQQASLTLADATATVLGDLHDAWNLSWRINIPSLGKIVPGMTGLIKSTGEVAGDRASPRLHLTLSAEKIRMNQLKIHQVSGDIKTDFQDQVSDKGEITIRRIQYGDYLVPEIKLQSASAISRSKFINHMVVILDNKNNLVSDITLPKFTSFTDFNQKVKGIIKVNLTDLSNFKNVLTQTPQIKSLSGQITGKAEIEGKLKKPVIDAILHLKNGGLYASKLGLRLADMQVSAYYKTGTPVILNGNVNVGVGRLDVDGRFNIDSPALTTELNVRGDNLQVLNSKEYKIKVSPSLNLSYQNNDLFISGAVVIPQALIEPTDFSSTVTLPDDVVIVNKQNSSTIPTNIALNVKLTLGDDVQIKYHDLKTKLLGGITINQRPGNPPTATGELRIKEGTYKAYGKDLNIEEGRLFYTGNLLTNPGLALRATQRIRKIGFEGGNNFDNSGASSVYSGAQNLTVGVSVSGTLDKPILSLFSNPAGLSQGDILSYMLFGYPQSQASGASGLALLSAAGGMGGTAGPISGLTQSLGLDELSVGSTDYYDAGDESQPGQVKSSTTVNVGRNLGHNLSIHYSVGLFDQLSIFSLRYKLSNRFVIQTETSTLENGGDILYSLESAH